MFLLILWENYRSTVIICSLHSTMFLLILVSPPTLPDTSVSFTFHNVSINTSIAVKIRHHIINFTFHNVSINTKLPNSFGSIRYLFTFHNVSINTPLLIIFSQTSKFFTFHNVSINTKKQGTGYVYTSLYIPQCFY